MAEYFDRNGDPMALMTWAQKFEDDDYKRVEFTQIGEVEISTVWLGLDHGNPESRKIFESAVFGSGIDSQEETRQYATEDEARAGHAELVEKYKETK